MDAVRLSKDLMLKTIVSLGFKETDAQVYVYLTTEGIQKATDIAEALKLYKQQLYRSLKRLQRKGIVNATLERPAQFSAVSIEKALDFLIETKKEQALTLQASRKELLSSWKSMIEKHSVDS
jgi:sugar-specific transcriptional regulator TrmB